MNLVQKQLNRGIRFLGLVLIDELESNFNVQFFTIRNSRYKNHKANKKHSKKSWR